MKIFRRLLLLVTALLAIAAIVAATCPAQFAYSLVADRFGAVRLAGVTGSIWQGHAGSVRLFNVELGALDWQLQAVPLLQGTAIAQLNLHGGETTASGTIERAFDGVVDVHDAAVRVPAHVAAPALDIPALQLLGDLDVTLARARLRGAGLDAANGSVHWRNAAVTGAAQAQLGDLEATFATVADGSIAGVVRDLGGPLQLDGNFKVSVSSYDAEAKLAARDGNAQVQEALRYIGEPQADGSSLLKIHGQLLKVF